MKEGRRSNRIPKRIEATLYIMNHRFPITIRNISATGLCASIQATIPLGTRCTITFTHSTPHITLQGLVARYRSNEVGIVFRNLGEEQKQFLRKL